MECLHCSKNFEAKKKTAKFCSTSCRVMWNRKNGKNNNKIPEITTLQMHVIYNNILEAISKIGHQNNQPPIITGIINHSQNEVSTYKVHRSFEYFQRARVDCETLDEWNELKEEILNSELSQKQKILLTT